MLCLLLLLLFLFLVLVLGPEGFLAILGFFAQKLAFLAKNWASAISRIVSSINFSPATEDGIASSVRSAMSIAATFPARKAKLR